MSANLHLAAQGLAEAGWPVFPVDATTKRPKTEHGHLDATTDVGVIMTWRRLFEVNGAIATPTGNGLLVIDIDPRNGGEVPLWAPETLTVRTQSGGLHLHYSVDRDIKSRASLFGPGVDSKSAGGYVLVPPSPGYTWENIQPRTKLTAEWLETKVAPAERTGMHKSARRLAPAEWRRGIIHDQVVAWAAYFATVLDDEGEVEQQTWAMVQQARAAGVPIDNARDHIGSAIRWVLERERSKA